MSIQSVQKNLRLFLCFTSNKYVSELLYPCEVPFKTVDVQLRLLGVDVGADGEEVLRQGDNHGQRGENVCSTDKLIKPNPTKPG